MNELSLPLSAQRDGALGLQCIHSYSPLLQCPMLSSLAKRESMKGEISALPWFSQKDLLLSPGGGRRSYLCHDSMICREECIHAGERR
jgi:hypothetical protein